MPSRRFLLAGLAAAAGPGLAGCVAPGGPAASRPPVNGLAATPGAEVFDYDRIYAEVKGEKFPVPAVDYSKLDRAFLRQEVAYTGKEKPGTVVVDPKARFLYHVGENGRARRYGVGVGKEGFGWSGVADVRSKQEWPDWYPPPEMIKRRPDIKPQLTKLPSGIGMKGGPGNPVGARALYLWQGNKDTLYRIHGTIEPETIGTSVSSGCIRMINQDAIDLYARVPVGTKVVVLA
ncbi:L,D-transpeptidase [Enterovirga aerilata]|uniref:L,D-transpeptidase n=1 Tax=Enterovirga aerilata TaxID=2730920 RepID=A0A849I6Y9_9HYPH|nr:L,D-transpeptidase [Enterovirga sp. DB1703]NNM73051.1 L,D-transpeptidase [Enterovirga sp. DB1703]